MKRVLVLMSTYNGEKYLIEQLKSIMNQKHLDVSLFIRDDGSIDNTISIVDDYSNRYHNIVFRRGVNLKPAKSFMWILENCDIDGFDFFAFSDQDDIWLEDKMKSASDQLEKYKDIPALYYCRTQNVDCKLKKIDTLFTDTKHTTSIIDSIATGSLIPGCTMVFNRKLMDLLRLHSPENLTMHDTWVHLVCLSCGGIVIADETPHILYRQHDNNVLGSKKKSINYRFKRLHSLNQEYSNMVNELYENYLNYFNDSSKRVIEKCVKYKRSLVDKMRFLFEGVKSTLSPKDKLLFLYKVLISVF